MAASPLFVLWNPPIASVLLIGYGVVANLPFIVIQRYNRQRVTRVLAARAEPPALTRSPLGRRPGVVQRGSTTIMRVDQVRWVTTGARMLPLERRSKANSVPITAAATTSAMLPVATVTAT